MSAPAAIWRLEIEDGELEARKARQIARHKARDQYKPDEKLDPLTAEDWVNRDVSARIREEYRRKNLSDYSKRVIRAIDRDSEAIRKGITVWRGVDTIHSDVAKAEVGDELDIVTPTSTTFDESLAFRYARPDCSKGNAEILLKIQAPKGTRGVVMNAPESEFLLSVNQSLRIDRIDKSVDVVYRMEHGIKRLKIAKVVQASIVLRKGW